MLYKPWDENSPEWQHDVQEIVELQKKATAADIKAAEVEYHMKPELLTKVLEPEVTRERNPALFTLLDRLHEDMRAINDKVKKFWNTRRPYKAAPEQVRTLIPPHTNPAYPSGHTYYGVVWAEVLGQLMPARRETLRAKAENIAFHRVLTGMHYPVDIQGGRALARLTLGALLQNEAFQRDFEAARKELEKVKH